MCCELRFEYDRMKKKSITECNKQALLDIPGKAKDKK